MYFQKNQLAIIIPDGKEENASKFEFALTTFSCGACALLLQQCCQNVKLETRPNTIRKSQNMINIRNFKILT